MTHVLGRVTDALDQPRGPDAVFPVDVPEAWVAEGATVAITLPRNLQCARCSGGGCDLCERAGAVSLRGRKDPEEVIEVVLPPPSSRGSAVGAAPPILVVRIPQRGGLSTEQGQVRGHLLLQVRVAAEASACVTRVDLSAAVPTDEGAAPPPAKPSSRRPRYASMPDVSARELYGELYDEIVAGVPRPPSARPPAAPVEERRGQAPLVAMLSIGVLLLLALWLLLR